uniref:PTS EIIA type-2 domain-containing protein n=3 Tax=Caenorhabditis japonica TaxID=281687 RepID=A0A8R1HP67_CAEJA
MSELLCRTERVEHARNFRTEVRGLLDVDHLIQRAVIHQNMDHSHIHTILLTAQIDGLKQSHLGLATLEEPTNLGLEMEEVRIVALILSPSYEKHTKSAAEIARTFGTLLMNNVIRKSLLDSSSDDEIRSYLIEYAKSMSQQMEMNMTANPNMETVEEDGEENENTSKISKICPYYPFRGLIKDFKRRLAHYKSDYTDGIKDRKSISKVISTAVFLIFTILPTSIAYGMLNENNTNGAINVQKVILGQWIGSLIFGIFGGQQLLILSTTAPLSIYIAVIYQVAQSNGWNFFHMYSTVGIYAMGFLILASVFQLGSLMSFTTRSTEEIFSFFIALALIIKAIMAIVHVYSHGYVGCITGVAGELCDPAEPLLFIFLLFGTTWLSMTIISFRSSPYLSRWKRDLVSDYALPIAVLVFAFISFFGFSDVRKEQFKIFPRDTDAFFVAFYELPAEAQLPALGLSIPLAILFFMDQLLVTNTVDNKDNKLKKGSAHHWDLFVVGILNIFLSLFGLPWMHGALPSAYLHLKALSDVEDRLHNGYIQTVIVYVRETRLATLLAHLIMIPVYFFLVPYITVFIPTSIFNGTKTAYVFPELLYFLPGVFLFMAFSSLTGNEFWERILLIFTEQRAYPPTHYIRRVPQRTVHQFTIIEFVQLVILVAISFAQYHYVEMVFPIVIAAFIPFRYFILPLFIPIQYLEAIDGKH